MPNYLSPGVYVEEVSGGSKPIEGVGTAVAAFIGFAEKGPYNRATLVTNWDQFRRTFGDFKEDCYLPHAVYGYFNNGGGSCYVVRVGREDGDGTAAEAQLPSRTEQRLGTLKITALKPGAEHNDISVQVEDHGEGAPDDQFKLIIRKGGGGPGREEVYEGVTLRKGKNNVETLVNAQSKLVKILDMGLNAGLPEKRPAAGTYQLQGGQSKATAALAPGDFMGDVSQRTGLGGFEPVTEITMVAIPDLMGSYQRGEIDAGGVQAVQTALINHCENMRDRVAILDPLPGLSPQEVLDWRVNGTKFDSSYAALYYPWVTVYDPLTQKNIQVPPCGHIAGVWARNDTTRGVHKAPANEVVRGALDLAVHTTKGERDLLNPTGVNCVVAFPGQGIRVWGARTLSSDPEWRYVPIRRLFNYLEKSIEYGTQWVVFEPNDMDLWERIKRTLKAFLTREWRNGALFGATADQAFYVKCDAETNPPEVRDAGMVITEIGVAPVKPAEFVIFRISQKALEA
jgi:phage tail sheath protein FI